MNFEYTPKFDKDLKRLGKKWRSMPQDVVAIQRDTIPLYVEQKGIDIIALRRAFFSGKRAAVLQRLSDGSEVVKMRLDVADLGRNDKVRIVFVAVVTENRVLFIELFAKNEKLREDANRIKKYLG